MCQNKFLDLSKIIISQRLRTMKYLLTLLFFTVLYGSSYAQEITENTNNEQTESVLDMLIRNQEAATENETMATTKTLPKEPLITDRPDQTESAVAMPKGYFQLETGTMLTSNNEVNNWTINTNLFRYGIGKNVELRLVTDINQYTMLVNEHSRIGIGDLQVGLKAEIPVKKVELAYLGHVVLPTGNNYFSSDQFGLINKICLGHDVTNKISFGYNVGFDYYDEMDYALTYTYVIGFGLNDQVGFFVEVFGDSFLLEDFSASYDGGFTFLINPDLQLDFSIGTGITDTFNFYSLGLSWRVR